MPQNAFQGIKPFARLGGIGIPIQRGWRHRLGTVGLRKLPVLFDCLLRRHGHLLRHRAAQSWRRWAIAFGLLVILYGSRRHDSQLIAGEKGGSVGMDAVSWIERSVAFGGAMILGSLVEYVVHRRMHARWLLGHKHTEHHKDGWGQGWAGEFWDYFLGALFVIWFVLLYSIPAAIGWAAGVLTYCALAAYAHQLQHERPELCFWLRRPVHYLHHHHNMW